MNKKRIMVTGGGGFLGSHLVEKLKLRGCEDIYVVRSAEWDLTKENRVKALYEEVKPSLVFHLAGLVGGIGANKAHPGQFFYNNLMMGVLTVHFAWRYGVEKIVSAGAGCGYPEHAPMPLRESDFWSGFPQRDSAPYSLAKRMLHVQSFAYWEEFRFNSIVTIPGNIYGPYDNFDLEGAHVIPALVRKFVEAADDGASMLEVWGSGQPTRDFVYASDVAEGMILAAEKCQEPVLLNLSSGCEASIREVVEMLVEITGFRGEVAWNTSRPDGQSRRVFDVRRAHDLLGWRASTSLWEGLRLTVEWYRQHRASARNSMVYPGSLIV
jgi:GDP-L-fucose synthase